MCLMINLIAVSYHRSFLTHAEVTLAGDVKVLPLPSTHVVVDGNETAIFLALCYALYVICASIPKSLKAT